MTVKLELILDKAFEAIAAERKTMFAAFEKSMDQIKEITVEAIRSLGKQEVQTLTAASIPSLKPQNAKEETQPASTPAPVVEEKKPAPKKKPKKKEEPVPAVQADVIPEEKPVVAEKPKPKKTTKKKSKKKEEPTVLVPELVHVGSDYTAEDFTKAVIAETEKEAKEKDKEEEGLDDTFKDLKKKTKKAPKKKTKKKEEPAPEPEKETVTKTDEPENFDPVDLDLGVEDIRDDLPPDNLPKGFHAVWAKMSQLERRNLVKSFAKEGTNPNDPPIEERIKTIKKPVETLAEIEDGDEQEYLCEVLMATMMLDALTEQELADTWAVIQQGDKKSPKLFLNMIELAGKGELVGMFKGIKIKFAKQEDQYWGFAETQTAKTAKFIQELNDTYNESGFITEVDDAIKEALGVTE